MPEHSISSEVALAYTDEIIQSIREFAIVGGAGDIDRLDDLPRVLLNWAGLNLRIINDEQARASWGDMNKRLKDATATAAKLGEQLDNLDLDATELLWREAAESFIDSPQDDGPSVVLSAANWVDELEGSVSTLTELLRLGADRAARKKMGPQLASRIAGNRRLAVGELGTIWRWQTGHIPTRRVKPQERVEVRGGREYIEYGPFQDFVTACLSPLSPLVGKDLCRGINRDIRYTAKAMGKNPDDFWLSFIHNLE